MKRNTALWRARKRSILAAPKWLKTVQIAKGAYDREPGTFGPASEVVRIDPATGKPIDPAPPQPYSSRAV